MKTTLGFESIQVPNLVNRVVAVEVSLKHDGELSKPTSEVDLRVRMWMVESVGCDYNGVPMTLYKKVITAILSKGKFTSSNPKTADVISKIINLDEVIKVVKEIITGENQ